MPPQSGSNRRSEAVHPGVLVDQRFVSPLGIDVQEFARQLEIEPDALTEMLAGRASLSVIDAVRIGSALQLSPERLMRMQVRFDFAKARSHDATTRRPLFRPARAVAFPERFERGRLDSTAGQYAVVRYHAPVDGDDSTHVLRPGDMLRIHSDRFDHAEPLWSGPVLFDLDGDLYLPYVERKRWSDWFDRRLPADLHLA